jgi:TRAP-type C4-dicarboxylate transport system permease small subunit
MLLEKPMSHHDSADKARQIDVPVIERKALAAVEYMSIWAARGCGILLLVSTAAICAEVLVRGALGRSIFTTDELSGYTLAIMTSWGLSLALLRLAHVRIDLLRAAVPAPIAAVLDLFSSIVVTGFGAFLAWYATEMVFTAYERGFVSNTTLETPMFIPQGIWALGLWIFVLSGSVVSLSVLRRLVQRDWDGVAAIAGVQRADDEARAQVRELQEGAI